MNQRSQTGPAESAAILFEGVTKRFVRTDGSELLAVENVSFAASPGRIVALLGPSGSGKTTLLNMAAGLIEPDAGEVRIAGRGRAGAQPGDGRRHLADGRAFRAPGRADAVRHACAASGASRQPKPQRAFRHP